MTDQAINSSAYHEAGHVIVSLSQGFTPEYVEIYYNTSESRWEGTTKLPVLTGISTESKIALQLGICVAGCFAQVKHAIQEKDPDVPIPWRTLLDWMVSTTMDPLELELGNGQQLIIPAWWFKGQDQQSYADIVDITTSALGNHKCTTLLQNGVRKLAIPILEDSDWWRKLEQLAAMLVGAVIECRGRLNKDEIPA